VYLTSQVTSGSASGSSWRLVDPYGNAVTANTNLNASVGRITLNLTGTYTLLVEGAIGNTSNTGYTWNAIPVVDPAPELLTLGSVVSGNLNAPSELDRYTFTLSSNALLYFDSLTNNANFNWSLTGPTGQSGLVNFTGDQGSGPIKVVSGDYTLTVSASG